MRTRLAFFGSTSLLARELRALSEGAAFPGADVALYDAAAEGTITEYDGEALLVTRPDEDLVPGLDVAFLCGSASESAGYLDWPARHGYVAIDLSGASAGRAGVPLIHTGINPEALAPGGVPAPLITAPHAVSHNVATLVAALRQSGAIESVEAFAFRPAADCGEAGLDELYRQTVALLNFSAVPTDALGRQLAFNILPSGLTRQAAEESFDARIRDEISRLTGVEPPRITVASAFVPVFHGHATLAIVTFAGRVGAAPDGPAGQALARYDGIRRLDDPGEFSPVDLAGEGTVAVAGPWADPLRPERLRFWCFCDNLKGGAALNAVRIAERVVGMRREAGR